MRIVVENGSYHMDNLGDIAMLQVLVGRILERWPDASVQVLVETPERLREACPGAVPLAPSRWHRIPMTTRSRGPAVRRLERTLPLHLPGLARWARRRQVANHPDRTDRLDGYWAALRDADAVVCSGGGFLNDHHAEHGDRVLHTLALAQGLGKPTAMFGAGFGPLEEPGIQALARQVLGRLTLLGLREREGNLRELERWGARPHEVRVTGDDAIEPARRGPAGAPGTAVGLSLRYSSEYGLPEARGLGEALTGAAGARGAAIVGLPVRTHRSPQNDVEALEAMLGERAPSLEAARAVETPQHLHEGVGGCRVVVSGTYHAGVFALSRGVPVVALSGSEYYDRKFAGLLEQFGGGVRILRYDEPDLPGRFDRAFSELWDAAPGLRPGLLAAADRQVEAGRAAYDTFFRRVEWARPGRGGRSA